MYFYANILKVIYLVCWIVLVILGIIQIQNRVSIGNALLWQLICLLVPYFWIRLIGIVYITWYIGIWIALWVILILMVLCIKLKHLIALLSNEDPMQLVSESWEWSVSLRDSKIMKTKVTMYTLICLLVFFPLLDCWQSIVKFVIQPKLYLYSTWSIDYPKSSNTWNNLISYIIQWKWWSESNTSPTSSESATIQWEINISWNSVFDKEFMRNAWKSFNCNVWQIIPTKDNKIIVHGCFTKYNDINLGNPPLIVRLYSNGKLDTSFKSPKLPDGLDIRAIASQSDGKILLWLVWKESKNPYTTSRLIRLLENWELDSSFNSWWLWFKEHVTNIKVLWNDDIIVSVGWVFPSYNWTKVSSIVRLTKNWDLDTQFNRNILTYKKIDDPIQIEVLDDGSIIVLSDFFQSYKVSSLWILDESFKVSDFGEYLYDSSNSKHMVSNNDELIMCWSFQLYSGYIINGILKLDSKWRVIPYQTEENKLRNWKCLIDKDWWVIKYWWLESDLQYGRPSPKIYKFKINWFIDTWYALSNMTFVPWWTPPFPWWIATLVRVDDQIYAWGYFDSIDGNNIGYIAKFIIK